MDSIAEWQVDFAAIEHFLLLKFANPSSSMSCFNSPA
jgi:hypothetical protein